jgi:hypothetical protein
VNGEDKDMKYPLSRKDIIKKVIRIHEEYKKERQMDIPSWQKDEKLFFHLYT